MMKLFENVDVSGKLLPHDKFRLFIDLNESQKPEGLPEQLKNAMISQGEKQLNNEFPVLSAQLYREYCHNGNRINFENCYFHRRGMLGSLLYAELIEGQGRFIDKIIEGIWMILEETSWVLPAHNRPLSGSWHQLPDAFADEVAYVDLFAAETSALLAWVYYFFGDAMDEAVNGVVKARIEYELQRRIIKPILKYDMHWMNIRGVNWTIWIVSNILTVCSLCMKDMDEKKKVVDKCLCWIDQFVEGYKPDGGCVEGTRYWHAAGASLFDSLEILYDMTGGAIDRFEVKLVRTMGEFIMKMFIDRGLLVNFGDSSLRYPLDSLLTARYGRRTKSRQLECFGLSQTDYNNVQFSYLNTYRNVKNLFEFPGLNFNVDYKPEKYYYLENMQLVNMREKNNTKGWFVSVKGGNNGESHCHDAIGNYVVYHSGIPIICDSGIETYARFQKKANNWFNLSSYHNTPDINGFGQNHGEEYRAENVIFNESSSSIKMNIEKAYPDKAEVKMWQRSVQLKESKVYITECFEIGGIGNITLNHLLKYKPDISKKGIVEFDNHIYIHYPEEGEAELDIIDLTYRNKEQAEYTDPSGRKPFYSMTEDRKNHGEFVTEYLVPKTLYVQWEQKQLFRLRLIFKGVHRGTMQLVINI